MLTGDARAAPCAQVVDHRPFIFAEGGFALFGEDFGDRFSHFRFDQFIRIQESEAKVLGGQAADGRFAGAHETDQGDVLYDALVAHKRDRLMANG